MGPPRAPLAPSAPLLISPLTSGSFSPPARQLKRWKKIKSHEPPLQAPPHPCRWGNRRPRDTGAQRCLESHEADNQATRAEPSRSLCASVIKLSRSRSPETSGCSSQGCSPGLLHTRPLRSNPSVGTSTPVLPAAHTAPPTILLKGSLRAASPLQLYAHDDDLLRLKAFSTLHGLRASRFLPPGQTSLRHPSLATQLPAQLLHIEARRLQ